MEKLSCFTHATGQGNPAPARNEARIGIAIGLGGLRIARREEQLIMPLGQRVVLIGGGHNALITAFYLAKGGFKPLILERRELVGGVAITEEFHPVFTASTLAHTLGPLRAEIARDMQIEKFGCEIPYPGPRV